ncbi:MAG: DUF4326 domain-containing protein [Rhodospirillum sp.]|nr:DUF4326 domain-containing protein [Rhodospirillum sp.]MCF8489828.1 DUF4326 domain-containing protein [Rhodospirillum sp.]MCF8499677.1 DUF4326 domain-containing protein [Rhodospirillum sp.]
MAKSKVPPKAGTDPSQPPKRLRRSRTRGWRMPADALYVGRPTRFGNPFPTFGDWTARAAAILGYPLDPLGVRQASLALFRGWLLGESVRPGPKGTALNEGAPSAQAVVVAVAASGHPPEPPKVPEAPPPLPVIRETLAGADLVCWCRLDEPCHADLLILLANSPPPT